MGKINILLSKYSVNIKNSIYFLMPSILGLILNLFTFPVFSKHLSSYDFAVIGYFEAIGQIFLPIMNLSFYSYYMKDFFSRSDEENKILRASLIKFLSVINVLIILIGLFILVLYFNWANVTFPIYPYGLLSVATLYFSVYISFLGIEYKMNKKGLKYLFLQCVGIILPVSLGLYFVIGMNMGAAGRMLGTFLPQLILGIFAFKLLYIKSKLDFSLIKKALAFGYPLIIGALLDIPVIHVDRIILEGQSDIESFALYSIGIKMAGIIFMVGSAVYQAFEPDFYKYISQRNKKNFLQMLGIVFGFLLVVNIIFTLFSQPIISLLTSNRYTGASQFANIMVWSNFVLLFSYAVSVILIVQGKTKQLLYRKIIVAVVGVTVFTLFIHNWGFTGGAVAKIVINLVNCGLIMFYIGLSTGRIRVFQKNISKVRNLG